MHDILIGIGIVIILYGIYKFAKACYLAWMFSQFMGWRTPRRGR